MPSGVVHRAATIRAIPIASLVACIIPIILNGLYPTPTEFIIATLISLFGYALGYIGLSAFIDPDSDQISITISEGRLMRKLGCVGFVMVWWMMPYGYVMTHRGVSHWHVIGTITRIVWIMWLPVLLYLVSGYTLPFSPFVYPFLGSTFFGLTLADSLHIWMDNRK